MKNLLFTTWKRWGAMLLCTVFILLLSGCGAGSNSFTWFVEKLPSNLDPQIAVSSENVIACKGLYSGLVRMNAEDELVNDLCESYTVSPDGLTYTFRLKPNLFYTATRGTKTDYTITAEDFVFAFRRIFRPETRSPYATDFAAIQNSADVLDGSLPEEALGVWAEDDLTLVFRLTTPDANFLEKLALPAAVPCDEVFFNSTRGTYGLTSASTISSGSFYLYNWTSGGVFLRRTVAAPLVDSLRLVQNTSGKPMTPTQLIENERCTAALDTGAEPTNLNTISYTDTVWCLLLNPDTAFSSLPFRQALVQDALSVDALPESDLYRQTDGVVPGTVEIDGVSYREQVGAVRFSSEKTARELYAQALKYTSVSKNITLLIPDNEEIAQVAGQINSIWQQDLGLFFSIERVNEEEFSSRIASGNYTIALSPFTMSSRDVSDYLTNLCKQYRSGFEPEIVEEVEEIESPAKNNRNKKEKSEPIALEKEPTIPYPAQQLQAALDSSGEEKCRFLVECERALLESCTVTPLFSQQKRLVFASGVRGLVFDPYGPVLDVTYTTKN